MFCVIGRRIWMCPAKRRQFPPPRPAPKASSYVSIVSRGNRRFSRKLLLVVSAMGALIWVAMDQFGISRGEIGELLMGTLLAVATVIVAAGVAVLLWIALRRLFFRSGD